MSPSKEIVTSQVTSASGTLSWPPVIPGDGRLRVPMRDVWRASPLKTWKSTRKENVLDVLCGASRCGVIPYQVSTTPSTDYTRQ